jgi:pimeloyl-ACP methyl ester carboxylesterase
MSRTDHTFQGSDGEFHYIDWGGSGPIAHFAHATGLCAGVYTPLANRLNSGLKILGLDDRGHGKTTAPANPKTLKNWNIFVSDLEQFFESLNRPVIAMGHSRGATASLLLAVRRPDLIRALVLVDPTILPYSWTWGWALAKTMGLSKRIPIAATAAKRKNGWPDRERILASYKEKAVFRSWTDDFLEAYVNDGTKDNSNGTIKLRCQPAWESRCFAVCPHDVWRYIPQLQQPVLVLYGAESDTFLASAAKRFKAEVTGAQMHRLEATSHFVPMERPNETTRAIFSFLEKERLI